MPIITIKTDTFTFNYEDQISVFEDAQLLRDYDVQFLEQSSTYSKNNKIKITLDENLPKEKRAKTLETYRIKYSWQQGHLSAGLMLTTLIKIESFTLQKIDGTVIDLPLSPVYDYLADLVDVDALTTPKDSNRFEIEVGRQPISVREINEAFKAIFYYKKSPDSTKNESILSLIEDALIELKKYNKFRSQEEIHCLGIFVSEYVSAIKQLPLTRWSNPRSKDIIPDTQKCFYFLAHIYASLSIKEKKFFTKKIDELKALKNLDEPEVLFEDDYDWVDAEETLREERDFFSLIELKQSIQAKNVLPEITAIPKNKDLQHDKPVVFLNSKGVKYGSDKAYECPDRVRGLSQKLQRHYSDRLYVGTDQVSDNVLKLCHSAEYLKYLKALKSFSIRMGINLSCDQEAETFIAAEPAARQSVFNMLTLVEVFEGKQGGVAFNVSRPPSHHAYREKSSGFCIYNATAIAAAYYASLEHGQKVVIFDVDIHEGDGSRDCLNNLPPEMRKRIDLIDIHGAEIFPNYKVRDDAKGILSKAKVKDIIVAIKSQITLIEKEKVGLCIISLGLDGHKDEPLMQGDQEHKWLLVQNDYLAIIQEIQQAFPRGNVLVTLEGGYDGQIIKNTICFLLDKLTSTKIMDKQVTDAIGKIKSLSLKGNPSLHLVGSNDRMEEEKPHPVTLGLSEKEKKAQLAKNVHRMEEKPHPVTLGLSEKEKKAQLTKNVHRMEEKSHPVTLGLSQKSEQGKKAQPAENVHRMEEEPHPVTLGLFQKNKQEKENQFAKKNTFFAPNFEKSDFIATGCPPAFQVRTLGDIVHQKKKVRFDLSDAKPSQSNQSQLQLDELLIDKAKKNENDFEYRFYFEALNAYKLLADAIMTKRVLQENILEQRIGDGQLRGCNFLWLLVYLERFEQVKLYMKDIDIKQESLNAAPEEGLFAGMNTWALMNKMNQKDLILDFMVKFNVENLFAQPPLASEAGIKNPRASL